MIDLASTDVDGAKREVPREEKGNADMPPANQPDADWLAPMDVAWRNGDLDVCRIQPSRAKFAGDPVPDQRIILSLFGGDAGPDRGCRLLANPDMNQAAHLDDSEEHRQQDERHNENGLQRFLASLEASVSLQDVCVRRCTIWPIFATSPLFQATMPTTKVPRMMAAPITHSSVDCARFHRFI